MSTRTARFQKFPVSCIAAFVALVSYLTTMDRGVDFHDYGDFQTVPYILGIPYPTGYPGFVLLGWLWSHTFLIGDVAFRLNLFSVIVSAISAFVIAQIALETGCSRYSSLGAALLFAGGFSAWSHSGMASPHVLGELCVFAALLFPVRARGGSASQAETQTAIILCGVSFAIDSTTLLCVPGIMVVLFPRVWLAPQAKRLWFCER
jgi:hypothetical protein